MAIKFGFLYNWYAASDARNIANTGWHVPTYSDFVTLQTYVGTDGGGDLKAIDSSWKSPNYLATDLYNFTALGSNLRFDDGLFSNDYVSVYDPPNNQEGEFAAFWSSEEDEDDYAYILQLYHDTENLDISTSSYPGDGGDDPKNNGGSIRLIKDSTDLDPGETGTYTGNDGRVYNTICVGTQEWLSENLTETRYRNLERIPEVTDNTAWNALTTGAFCAYDNNWNYALDVVGISMNTKFIRVHSPITLGPLGSGLRAYWKFDEVSGNTIYDVFYASNGIRMGDTTLGVTGKLNYCASYDGSGDFVDFGATVGDVGTSDFTLAGWVYLISSVNSYNGICGNWGTEPFYYIMFNESDFFRVRLGPSYGVAVDVLSNGGVSTGVWYHFAAVFDRDGYLSLYINGSEQIDKSSIAAYSGLNISNPNTFNTGNIGSGLVGYFGHVRTDAIGLWLRALSGGEISQLYNSGSGFDYPFI